MLDLNQKIASRTIRVFLSSTFRDMAAERSHLINQVFPHLRAVARERSVEFTEVDLRWGITDSQAQSGQVVRLCLKEIDLCKEKSDDLPFFVGLVGDRYGWVPTEVALSGDKNLKGDFPEVTEYIGSELSVTEMEMTHAVFRRISSNPALLAQSYFFFRDPAYTVELAGQGSGIIYTDDLDQQLSQASKEHAKRRLQELRGKIGKAMEGNPPLTYRNSEDLGEQVTQAFQKFLDAKFPGQAKPETLEIDDKARTLPYLERERQAQALFAQTRLKVHVGGERYFQALRQNLTDKRPVVVTGGVGSGKTALLANFIADFQKDIANPPVLYHFCGGASDSDKLDTMLRRLISELQVFAGSEINLPKEATELPTALIAALYSVPHTKPLVLVVDALDQLDSHGNLNWLPATFPDHVQMVASLKSPVEGVEHELVPALETRGFARIPVEPLTVEERQEII